MKASSMFKFAASATEFVPDIALSASAPAASTNQGSTLQPAPALAGVAQSEMTGGLKALFGKHGLADMMEKVCQELGVDSVEDLGYVEKKHVEALTWLKPIKQAKLLRLTGLSGAEAAERRECVVCFAGGSDVAGWVILQPCGHVCVCNECGKGLEQCPLCRQAVTAALPAFL